MEHTPGPWELVEVGDRCKYLCPAKDNQSLLTIAIERNDDGKYVEFACVYNRADAHMMASAPKLLSALKNMVRAYVSLLESGRDRIIGLGGDCDAVELMELNSPELREAKAAIEESTGGI